MGRNKKLSHICKDSYAIKGTRSQFLAKLGHVPLIKIGPSPLPHNWLAPLFVCLLLMALVGTAMAGDDPFDGPANWGGTGLMEIPTARVMREGRYRFGVGQVYPYRYYYAAVSPFDWFEVEGKVTEILGVTASPGDPNWQGYGNDKDK